MKYHIAGSRFDSRGFQVSPSFIIHCEVPDGTLESLVSCPPKQNARARARERERERERESEREGERASERQRGADALLDMRCSSPSTAPRHNSFSSFSRASLLAPSSSRERLEQHSSSRAKPNNRGKLSGQKLTFNLSRFFSQPCSKLSWATR